MSERVSEAWLELLIENPLLWNASNYDEILRALVELQERRAADGNEAGLLVALQVAHERFVAEHRRQTGVRIKDQAGSDAIAADLDVKLHRALAEIAALKAKEEA